LGKIVGIGYSKTGTKTLGECLQYLGFRHKSYDRSAVLLWKDERSAELLDIAAQYDSFEDLPWALMYEELDRRFPNSKFILTRRSTPEVWHKSLCKHADRDDDNEIIEIVYGFRDPHPHQHELVSRYVEHLESVRRYFYNRPQDFIEVCWEDGDGWRELADFLRVDCPESPFPHSNRAPTFLEKLKRYVKKRLAA
jgi:hypothetical protein